MTSVSEALARNGWSQKEAIASECAREAITHAMAIITADIARGGEDAELSLLRAERTKMAGVRASLYRLDAAGVADVRSEYDRYVSKAIKARIG